jgi:NitT/TauT family transport system substrate-binding protein
MLKLAVAVAALVSGPAEAHHQMLMLQLSGITQAQFAGYYVADYQGFYDEMAIEVIINPGGPSIEPARVLADGGANIIVEGMPAALAAREQGLPLVNIAQLFKHSGRMLACRKDTGIAAPADLKGRTIAAWSDGDGDALAVWLARQGLSTDGGAERVSVLDHRRNVGPFPWGRSDCISLTSYDGHGQLLDAGLQPEELVRFRYGDDGAATLEDGLYVLEQALAAPDYVATLAAFLEATMRGWQWARENPVEAARIVVECNTGDPLTEEAQVRMMHEINRLTEGSDGVLDPADYERTVEVLLAGVPPSAITRRPVGAWSHLVTDAAELGRH